MRTFSMVLIGCAMQVMQASSPLAPDRAPAGTIDGIVADTALAPLEGATVSILGSSLSVVTGPNGRFRMFDVPVGNYMLLVRRLGYDGASTQVSVSVGDVARLSFSLAPAAQTLAAIDVHDRGFSPRMSEFYDRKAHGFGTFITRGDIEKRNVRRAYELFYSIPSVGVTVSKYGVVTLRSLREECAMDVVIDGLPLAGNNYPAPEEIGGIEVYPGPATIPLQFKGYKSSNAMCGLVLIWTGDGR